MLNDKQIEILKHIAPKFNLNLAFEGKKVLKGGAIVNPWQLQEIYDKWYPIAREEFIGDLFLKSINEIKISNESSKVDIPQE